MWNVHDVNFNLAFLSYRVAADVAVLRRPTSTTSSPSPPWAKVTPFSPRENKKPLPQLATWTAGSSERGFESHPPPTTPSLFNLKTFIYHKETNTREESSPCCKNKETFSPLNPCNIAEEKGRNESGRNIQNQETVRGRKFGWASFLKTYHPANY